jgi:hypothetical protein
MKIKDDKMTIRGKKGEFFEETKWEDSRTYAGETVTSVHTGSKGNAIHIVWSKGNHFVHIHCKSKKDCHNEWNEKEGTAYDKKFDVVTKEDEGWEHYYLEITCKKCNTLFPVNL